jgi:ParB-like chromosome segregation protein Spo0J
MNLKLSDIRIDGDLQVRAAINDAVVADYYDVLREGGKLPPVVVFFDSAQYHLADGNHRYHAHKSAGLALIEADVREGTKRDAMLYALGANAEHGFRRTTQDKQRAVKIMLNDMEWMEWSDREIAKQCKVSHPFVSKVRKDIGASVSEVKYERNGQQESRKLKDNDEIDEVSEGNSLETKVQELATEYAELAEEKAKLEDRIAVAAMDATEEEKQAYADTLESLRSQVKALEAENRALKATNRAVQDENNQLKKQVNYWKKQVQKGTK